MQDPSALVQADQIHRDVYVDAAVFALEMQRLWARSRLYVGHASQVPRPGDYLTTSLATRPVLMVRHTDGTVHVLRNRCAHRGAMVCTQASGHAGAALRRCCPSFRRMSCCSPAWRSRARRRSCASYGR